MSTNITVIGPNFQTLGRPVGYSSSITTNGGLDVSGNLAITGNVTSKPKIWYSYNNGSQGNVTYGGGQIIGNNYGSLYFSGHNYYNGANTGVWSGGDGVFTAPEDGVYVFYYYLFCNSPSSVGRVSFYTNSSYFSYTQYGTFEITSPNSTPENVCCASYVAYMNSGSIAYVYILVASLTYYMAPMHTNLYIVKMS